MDHFSEIGSLRPSLQFLAFSDAYLESAGRLCDFLDAHPAQSNYPKGAVVLSLAFHGIELFLKAAILERVPNEQFGGTKGHDLEHLGKRYMNIYSAKKYAFDIPFRYEEILLVDPDPRIVEELKLEIAELKRANPPDQLNRYPHDIKGNTWQGCYSFEASSFAITIAKMQQDIARLQTLIFVAKPTNAPRKRQTSRRLAANS